MPEVLKIAHRGASGHKPENTLSAFSKALEMGVDVIELDVRVCGTGELVVMHDATLERTTNGKGIVADTTLEELKKLDAGDGEQVPTLEEAIDLINRKTVLNIEIKGEGIAEKLSKILKTYLDKGYPPELFIITSFSRKEFHKFSIMNPGVRLGILVARGILSLSIIARKYNAYSIHLPQPYLKKRLVKFFQRRGYKVYVYTLNSIWDIAKAKIKGVDGIFSDYPERI
ncbi:MAG: glycerophosphodiester phosphodiesterase [Candidatus Colwellbacteria bacterium]|nr:glycerophosphodiester phosphodiesterase [Candidatus Colwellbacteria bacterium]